MGFFHVGIDPFCCDKCYVSQCFCGSKLHLKSQDGECSHPVFLNQVLHLARLKDVKKDDYIFVSPCHYNIHWDNQFIQRVYFGSGLEVPADDQLATIALELWWYIMVVVCGWAIATPMWRHEKVKEKRERSHTSHHWHVSSDPKTFQPQYSDYLTGSPMRRVKLWQHGPLESQVKSITKLGGERLGWC